MGASTEGDRLVQATGPLTDALNWFASSNAAFGGLPRVDDHTFATLGRLQQLAERVRAVGAAFALADGRPLSVAGTDSIGMLLFELTWTPKANVVSGSHAGWLKAVYGKKNPCSSAAGYEGAAYGRDGFIKGPDGRMYPLVAPFVTRDGVVYNEDRASADGGGVWSLDGRDPGWVTTMVRTGVERWRDEPDGWDLLQTGIAATATVVPRGSTPEQVKAVVMQPGLPPRIGEIDHENLREQLPPFPDEVVPKGVSTACADLVMVAGDALLAALNADNGSMSAYQVVFQKNTIDGRIRAVYTVVDVRPPQQAGDRFVLNTARVMGPRVDGIEPQDPVVYAP